MFSGFWAHPVLRSKRPVVYCPSTGLQVCQSHLRSPEQLQAHSEKLKSGQWSTTLWCKCRAGNEEADSSEEEDAKNSAHQQSESLLNTMLDAHDGNVQLDQQGNIIQPSLAFCQALDNEQEYDDVDAVAGTTLRGVSDPADDKPSRLTEVPVAPVMHVCGVCYKISYTTTCMSTHQAVVWHML